MTDKFTMSANAHHPRVKNVARLSDGTLVVNLGGTSYAHVSILTTDEEWRQIVRDVDQQVAKMGAEKLVAGTNFDYCPDPDCSWIGYPSELADHITDSHGKVSYPRKNAAGETVWACCESSIGPVCDHRRIPEDVEK
jgi:hypothetical protein